MPYTLVLSDLAETLFNVHTLHYYAAGYAVGSFEMVPGRTEAEITEAYDDLVAAGLMHRGRLAGYHDPGTYILATSAVPSPDHE